jgi:hypothetical protein
VPGSTLTVPCITVHFKGTDSLQVKCILASSNLGCQAEGLLQGITLFIFYSKHAATLNAVPGLSVEEKMFCKSMDLRSGEKETSL